MTGRISKRTLSNTLNHGVNQIHTDPLKSKYIGEKRKKKRDWEILRHVSFVCCPMDYKQKSGDADTRRLHSSRIPPPRKPLRGFQSVGTQRKNTAA